MLKVLFMTKLSRHIISVSYFKFFVFLLLQSLALRICSINIDECISFLLDYSPLVQAIALIHELKNIK